MCACACPYLRERKIATCVKDTYDNSITHAALVKNIGRGLRREAKKIPTPSRLQLVKTIRYDSNNTRQL